MRGFEGWREVATESGEARPYGGCSKPGNKGSGNNAPRSREYRPPSTQALLPDEKAA